MIYECMINSHTQNNLNLNSRNLENSKKRKDSIHCYLFVSNIENVEHVKISISLYFT